MSNKNNAQKAPKNEELKNQAGQTVDASTEVPVSEALLALRAQAVELGMPEEDAEVFTDEVSLQATINVLSASKARAEEAEERAEEAEKTVEKDKEVKRVATLEERPNPTEDKQIAKAHLSKAETMRAKLEAQPKVRVLLPIIGEEKAGVVRDVMINGRKEQVVVSGAVEVVTLNGFKTFIPKGQYVEVPQQVADELNQSYINTQKAGEDFLIDRIDPKTGQPVRNQL